MTSQDPGTRLRAHPLTERCASIYDGCRHAVFGVSPFNGHFTEPRLRNLFRWGCQRFDRIHVFVPDEPAAFTLEALGYAPARARHKARRQANYLHNKIHRALEAVGSPIGNGRFELLNWERLQQNLRYRDALERCRRMFADEPEFREACLDSARWALHGRAGREDVSEPALHRAVEYFLVEVPLFANSPEILDEPASVFCYHQSIPFLDNLYRERLAWIPDRNQGFVVLEPAAD